MWSLYVWLAETVPAPKLQLADVVDSSNSPTIPGTRYPIEYRTEILVDAYAPKLADTNAMFAELADWLRTVPGDWAIKMETGEPVASFIDGRLRIDPVFEPQLGSLRAASAA